MRKHETFFRADSMLCRFGWEDYGHRSPNERNILDPLTQEQAWNYAQETFAACAEFAQEQNVILCMEPLTSEATNFINTPAAAVEMVKAIDNPNFQIILDVTSTAAENWTCPRRFANTRIM